MTVMKARWEDFASFVLTIAQEIAYPSWYHEYVDTIHILAALLSTPGCTASLIVGECGVHPTTIVSEIKKRFPPGPPFVIMGSLPLTRRVLHVWEHARAEAFPDDCFGSEHILLGLLDDSDSDAAAILKYFGLSKKSVTDALTTITRATQA